MQSDLQLIEHNVPFATRARMWLVTWFHPVV